MHTGVARPRSPHPAMTILYTVHSGSASCGRPRRSYGRSPYFTSSPATQQCRKERI